MWIGIVVTFLGCVIAAVIGRRAATGRLARNYVAGIRTTATLATDDAWERAHDVAGHTLLSVGVGCAVGTLFVAGLAIAGADQAWIAGGIIAIAACLAIGVVVAGVRGDRAARMVTPEQP